MCTGLYYVCEFIMHIITDRRHSRLNRSNRNCPLPFQLINRRVSNVNSVCPFRIAVSASKHTHTHSEQTCERVDFRRIHFDRECELQTSLQQLSTVQTVCENKHTCASI